MALCNGGGGGGASWALTAILLITINKATATKAFIEYTNLLLAFIVNSIKSCSNLDCIGMENSLQNIDNFLGWLYLPLIVRSTLPFYLMSLAQRPSSSSMDNCRLPATENIKN
jgi:hypothetical protein